MRPTADIATEKVVGHLPTLPSVCYLEFEISLISMPRSRQPSPTEQCPKRSYVAVRQPARLPRLQSLPFARSTTNLGQGTKPLSR